MASPAPRPRPGGRPVTVEVETVERITHLTALERGPRALAAMAAASPHDPWPMVWFAEALQRHHEYAAARRCGRVAFDLALKALDERPTATEHLHVLARVLLSRGFAVAAVPLAACSAMGSSADLALVTLAAALRACREQHIADEVARAAVRRGSTLGHQVLAAGALDDHRYDDAVRHLDGVRRADLIRYHGVDPTIEHTAADVPPLIHVHAPPVDAVLDGISAAMPLLVLNAPTDVLILVEPALAIGRSVGLGIGTPEFDASAFPDPFA